MNLQKNTILELFADDTTLIFANCDLDSVISSLEFGLNELNEWCKHNRLYINWSKTFIMIITNKRLIKPEFIEFDNIKIKVVSSFKLLGVLIDDKLNFQSYVAQQCLNINRKLFSIKRIFYLSFAVKLQFFKSFILPLFDYGISLSIYYNHLTIRKLCKMYYVCLKKLLNFSFIDNNFNIKSNTEINLFLKNYKLFSFHHRLTLRLLLFIHRITGWQIMLDNFIKIQF